MKKSTSYPRGLTKEEKAVFDLVKQTYLEQGLSKYYTMQIFGRTKKGRSKPAKEEREAITRAIKTGNLNSITSHRAVIGGKPFTIVRAQRMKSDEVRGDEYVKSVLDVFRISYKDVTTGKPMIFTKAEQDKIISAGNAAFRMERSARGYSGEDLLEWINVIVYDSDEELRKHIDRGDYRATKTALYTAVAKIRAERWEKENATL